MTAWVNQRKGISMFGRIGTPIAAAFAASLLVLVAGASFAESTSAATSSGRTYNVVHAPYNAKGDGATNDRASIQRAIDDAGDAGGGTVFLPDTRDYLSGNLVLRTNVTLQIEGTLLESQNPADYTYKVLLGHNRPIPSELCATGGTCAWDHAFYHNLPFIYASDSQNVGITGSGIIQMRWSQADEFSFQPPMQDNQTIHSLPIGFYRVSDFVIRDVSIIDAHTYNMGLMSTSDGLVDHIRIIADHHEIGSDGIAIQNSQRIRITNSMLNPNDDAVYIWASYKDPRSYVDPTGGQLWWSSDNPRPTKDIEVDHNVIRDRCCKAVGLIAWGSGAPNLEDVEISNISIHDNILNATEAVGIWHDNPNHGEVPFTGLEMGDQSPVRNVHIWNNVYQGALLDGSLGKAVITSLRTDFGMLGAQTVQNPQFDANAGAAWWTPVGDAGATQAFGGSAGYVALSGPPASLVEGLGMTAGSYRVTADVAATRGAAVTLSVRDTCSGRTLATQVVRSSNFQQYELTFTVATTCSDVEVGIARHNGASGAVGLIDNVTLEHM